MEFLSYHIFLAKSILWPKNGWANTFLTDLLYILLYISGPKVFCARQNYNANRHDEFNIKIDDYIVASEAAVENGDEEGWIFGLSLNSGESGYFPANYVSSRVPESDCWSLHARIHFIGSSSSLHYKEPQSDVNTQPTEVISLISFIQPWALTFFFSQFFFLSRQRNH